MWGLMSLVHKRIAGCESVWTYWRHTYFWGYFWCLRMCGVDRPANRVRFHLLQDDDHHDRRAGIDRKGVPPNPKSGVCVYSTLGNTNWYGYVCVHICLYTYIFISYIYSFMYTPPPLYLHLYRCNCMYSPPPHSFFGTLLLHLHAASK